MRRSQRALKPFGASPIRAVIRRIASRIRRTRAALRTTDLDSAVVWPDSVTVIERDDFGPLVIAIEDATVFPDGSVTSGGRWFVSARFGLHPHRREATDLIDVESPCAVIPPIKLSRRNMVASVGPRLATLGKIRPGIATVVPDTVEVPHHSIANVVELSGVKLVGVAISGGSARNVASAWFVRIPTSGIADGQIERFAQMFRLDANTAPERNIYLEHNDIQGPIDDASIVDARLAAESSGSTLIPVNRLSVDSIARAVASATSVTVESKELLPFVEFAHPTATVSLATNTGAIPRHSSRVTMAGRFDMDEALRDGLALPRGVDIISRPDYDVDQTTVDDHRVFRNGGWRPQEGNVLHGRSLGPWLISVKNAVVAPNGSVLLEDGTLLAGAYFGDPRHPRTIDGWISQETADRAGLAITMSRAFGHGLLQVAPRLDAFSRYDSSLPVLVSTVAWDDAPLFNVLGLAPHRVIRVPHEQFHHLVRVPELIVSTNLQPEAITARADPRWMSEFVTRLAPEPATTPDRRVYFARQDSSGIRGGCANRHELEQIATDFEYETVFPETMTFDEQIRLVASTVDMFGEQGSALTWSMFMPSGSRLVTVQGKPDDHQNRFMTFHNPVLAARGSRFYDVGAFRAGSHSSFEVDPTALRTAMEKLS